MILPFRPSRTSGGLGSAGEELIQATRLPMRRASTGATRMLMVQTAIVLAILLAAYLLSRPV